VSTYDECVYNFTTRPGTPEAVQNPTTHLTFSYATQVVILDEAGTIDRVMVATTSVARFQPRLCAEQDGRAACTWAWAVCAVRRFPRHNGQPDSLLLRDLGSSRQAHAEGRMYPDRGADEVGGYVAKGVGEIGCVATAGAVAGALYAYDGIRAFGCRMDDSPAAAPLGSEVTATRVNNATRKHESHESHEEDFVSSWSGGF